jgi:hypothetical protein
MGVMVMPQTADFVLERLREWGVHRVFAYPGDGINGILGAFGRAGGDPEFIRFPGSQDIPDVPYHKYAQLLGLRGIYCDEPGKASLARHGFRQKMAEYYEKLPGRDR